jgi:uncharacterized cupredoxin-like copper-binding protein
MTWNRLGACALIAVASVGFGACSSSSDNGETVNVTAKDFSLTPDVSSVVAGKVSFAVRNAGGFGHEMVVVKAADAKALPTKPDGEVDESAIAVASLIGEVTNVLPGQTKTLNVKLTPGKYVLFCNLVDGVKAVHFKRGMHADFTVTAAT